MRGIELWIQRNPTLGQLYFSSAKATGSHDLLLSELYPEGHQVLKDYRDAPPLYDSVPLGPPRAGSIWVDGGEGAERPLYRPAIFQYGTEGSVSTVLLEPGSPLPPYGDSAPLSTSWADISSSPSGALLTLAGGEPFPSPAEGLEVGPGRHEVRAVDPCYQPDAYAWEAAPGGKEEIFLGLTPVPASLEVVAVDASGASVGAEVSLDGAALGRTPLKSLVAACSESLAVTWKGEEWSERVELDPLGSTELIARFEGSSAPAVPAPPPPADSDKDGIFDSVDDCPHRKEDFDGVRDADGCPEDNAAQVRPVGKSMESEAPKPADQGRAGVLFQLDGAAALPGMALHNTPAWEWERSALPDDALPVIVRASFGNTEKGSWKPARGMIALSSLGADVRGGEAGAEPETLGLVSRESYLGFGLYTPDTVRFQLSVRAMAGIWTYRFSARTGILPVGQAGATGQVWLTRWLGIHGDACWRQPLEEAPYFSVEPLVMSGGISLRLGAPRRK